MGDHPARHARPYASTSNTAWSRPPSSSPSSSPARSPKPSRDAPSASTRADQRVTAWKLAACARDEQLPALKAGAGADMGADLPGQDGEAAVQGLGT